VDLRFLRTWSALAISTSSGAVELLGYAAATLTTVSFIPQAIKTLRTGDTRSISLRMYSLFTLGIALWGVYGVLVGDGPLIAANAITLITAGLILDRKWRALWSDHRKSRGSINQPRA
jgi:MtN3 and saliva related transmembrane protein